MQLAVSQQGRGIAQDRVRVHKEHAHYHRLLIQSFEKWLISVTRITKTNVLSTHIQLIQTMDHVRTALPRDP
jgi:hypothetical protein